MSPRRIVIPRRRIHRLDGAAAFATGMPGAQVELVESKNWGSSASAKDLPSIRAFNRLLGIDEADAGRHAGQPSLAFSS